MMNENNKTFLTLVKNFIESYALNHEAMTLNEWLSMELQSQMPDKSHSEIEAMSNGIISSIELTQSKRESLDKSMKSGMSKEGWFAREVNRYDNPQKLTNDLYSAAIHSQAGFLDTTIEYKEANVTPNEAARQIENAAVLGSVIDAEFCDVAVDESKHSEFIVESLKSGNDTGIKAATAGAIKSASENQILPALSSDVCAGVAYISTEKVKAAVNNLPFVEMVEEVERNAVSVTATFMAKKGASIGAAIGKTFGPVGAVVGGLIGAGLGYIAGTEAGLVAAKKLHEVRYKINQTAETYIAPSIVKAVKTTKNFGKKIAGLLSG